MSKDHSSHLEETKHLEPLLEALAPQADDLLSDEALLRREEEIIQLADKYSENKQAEELMQLISRVRPFLHLLSRTRAAKLAGRLVDKYLLINRDYEVAEELLKNCIEFAEQEKRSYMRRDFQARLMHLYIKMEKFGSAMEIGRPLATELKALDDKFLLIDVQMSEVKALLGLSNLV